VPVLVQALAPRCHLYPPRGGLFNKALIRVAGLLPVSFPWIRTCGLSRDLWRGLALDECMGLFAGGEAASAQVNALLQEIEAQAVAIADMEGQQAAAAGGDVHGDVDGSRCHPPLA
jgi:hypothetical protein